MRADLSLNLINTAESMALRLQTSTNETEIFVNNLMTDERSRTHETAQNKDQSELVEHDTNHDEGQDGTDNRLIMDYGIFFSNLPSNVYASTSYYVSSGVVVTDYFDEVNILPLLLS